VADRNPRRLSNWKLVCALCKADWLGTEKVETINQHFIDVHGLAVDARKVNLELLWVGRGPAPKSKPKIGAN
jgi:hypothetical protein